MLGKLINEQEAEQVIYKIRGGELTRPELEKMREEQLYPDTDGYKSFVFMHANAWLKDAARAARIGENPELAEKYKNGELAALAFLSNGDPSKEVITPEGIMEAIKFYSRPGPGGKLNLVMIAKAAHTEFLESTFVHVAFAAFYGDLYMLKDEVVRAGYTGAVAAAMGTAFKLTEQEK